MKTIGLIGGMRWESTITYYQVPNQATKEPLGGLLSSKCILYSVDFEEIEECQSVGDWEKSDDAVILGLTEIGLLVQQKDRPIRLFDTTLIHAKRAVLLANKT